MRRVIKALFSNLEKLLIKMSSWDYIPGSSMKMLYVHPKIYTGKSITLADGTEVNKGDMVGEIHIDNIKVERVSNDLRSIFHTLSSELDALGAAIIQNEKYKCLKACYGTTLLYPLVKKQGFTVVDGDKGISSFLIGVWENILRLAFSNKKVRARFIKIIPKQCWISKEQLLKRMDKQDGKLYEEEKL